MKWVATSVRLTTAPIEQMCQPNCNDQIAARAFGATAHYSPVFDLEKHADEYDAVFATMWKVRAEFETRWMDILHRLVERGKKVVLFQEAETSWPLGRSWEEQKSFIELLGKVDLFLTHNSRDVQYWGRLARKAVRWRTCLDLRQVRPFMIPPSQKTERPILFGSSYDERANGLAGLLAVRKMGHPLWHQNRSTGYADRNRDVPSLLDVTIEKDIPHCGWQNWLKEISGAYVAVHPMPAAAAGRDQIAFAALGIPCVGSSDLEIQRELFPMTQIIDIYNPAYIESIVSHLMASPKFYEECREHALELVDDQYGLPAAAEQAALIKKIMGWL